MTSDGTGATIPRVPHLVPHLTAVLGVLRSGASFEACRQTYMAEAARLAKVGKGRAVASRVGQAEAYWAPTSDLLAEGMHLGYIELQPIPSARQYIQQHADRTYRLTPKGAAAAELAAADNASFTTEVVNLLLQKHTTFQAFVLELSKAPLVLPVFDVRDIETADSVHDLARRAAEEINASGARAVEVETVLSTMRAWTQRRFSAQPEQPSRKARAELLSEACVAVALGARGIGGGPSDLKNLRAWGSNFRITDQSRYVNGGAGPFTVWLAADLDGVWDDDSAKHNPNVALSLVTHDLMPSDGQAFGVRRRGFAAHGDRIANALLAAYHRRAAESDLQAPYLPIHQVRAAAAFECGVVRVLADRVIEGMVNGSIVCPGVRMQLRINSDGDHPTSEPIYTRGGSPRYSMSIARQGNAPGGAA